MAPNRSDRPAREGEAYPSVPGPRGPSAPMIRGPGGRDPPKPRIALFGPVRSWDAQGRLLPIAPRKARALLGILLLAQGRPVSRARLAALLWENSGDAQARASLRQAVLGLGRALGNPALVGRVEDGLWIDPASVSVDALADPETAGDDSPPPLMEGMEGIGEGFTEYLALEREALFNRLRAGRAARLDRLAADPGRREEALSAARRLLALDTAHEHGWRCLMRLLAAEGDAAQALAAYARCREALRRALDAEPSFETRALAASLRAGSPQDTLPALIAPSAAPAFPLAWAPPAGDAPSPGRLRVGVSAMGEEGSGTLPGPSLRRMARDVALALVRYRHFDVLDASEMALAAPGGAGPALRYVVEVSIRPGSALLLTLLSLDGPAHPVWSGQEALEDGGAGAEAAARLVARLEPVILHMEGRRRSPREADALVYRAMNLLFSMEDQPFRLAGTLLSQAVAQEPENAMAAAWAAQWHVYEIGQNWAADPRRSLAEAERLAVLAMSLDPESAEAAATYGHVSSFLHKDFDSAGHYLGRSLELNPYQASAWALSAATQAYSGDPSDALRRMAQYRALAPSHPHDRILSQIFSTAHLLAGEHEQAVAAGRRAMRAAPGFVNAYKPLLAALGHLGRVGEARPVLQALLRVEPDFCVKDFIAGYPFRRPEDRETYQDGLLKAGAPRG